MFTTKLEGVYSSYLKALINPLAKEITYGRLHTWEIYIRMSQNLRILQTCLQFLARGLIALLQITQN